MSQTRYVHLFPSLSYQNNLQIFGFSRKDDDDDDPFETEWMRLISPLAFLCAAYFRFSFSQIIAIWVHKYAKYHILQLKRIWLCSKECFKWMNRVVAFGTHNKHDIIIIGFWTLYFSVATNTKIWLIELAGCLLFYGFLNENSCDTTLFSARFGHQTIW